MDDRRHRESGETLVEIIVAIVIMSFVVSAYFYTYITSSHSSKAQRDLVAADGILRHYAETLHAAVQKDCASSTTYTTTTTVLPPNFSAPTITPSSQNCPATTSVQLVTIDLTLPNGTTHKQLSTELRSP
jgi:type II secretory pathway pseudopilin PulG